MSSDLGVLDAHELPRRLVLGLTEQERVLAHLTLVHVNVDLAHACSALDPHVHLPRHSRMRGGGCGGTEEGPHVCLCEGGYSRGEGRGGGH